MARSRIAAMSASCLLTLAATLGSAHALTAGAPLPLLQIDHAKTAAHAHHPVPARTARTKPAGKAEHGRIARHVAKAGHARTRVADAGHDLPSPPATPTQASPQNNAQNVWPTSTTGALGYAETPKAPPSPTAAPGSVTTEHVVATDPNGILNGSHAVPAAMPTPVTPIASVPKAQRPTTKSATGSPSRPVKMAAVAPAAARSPIHAMLFRPSAPSAVGSASWIAQLLAALGGAVAAGAVAWLLIRPAPERHYS